MSLRYFACLWDTTRKQSHSCFRDCFWGCLPNSEWDLTKIVFATTRWKFLDSKPINSRRFSLTSTLSPMTHLDMVPTLSVPCMKLGTFHIMGHLSPSCESHSVIRGWLGSGGRQQRGHCPFLFLSWDKGKIGVKFNCHLTLGKIEQEPPNKVKFHYNFPCLCSYWEGKPFLLNMSSEVYMSKTLTEGPQAGVCTCSCRYPARPPPHTLSRLYFSPKHLWPSITYCTC